MFFYAELTNKNIKKVYKMPISLSKVLGIDSSELTDNGAFDPVLDTDTRLFIDPHLLKYCKIKELTESYKHFQEHFSNLYKILLANSYEGDVFWRQADSMMRWNEVKGLCIGYSTKGTSGSGIGPELRKRLLKTAKEIISQGIKDVELFELVGLLEEDFGSDRISDMTARIIYDDLCDYSKRVYRELGVEVATFFEIDKETQLPVNPYNGKPIILVPQSILRDLPVALDWSDRDIIAEHNQELRDSVNETIGSSWRNATQAVRKEELKKVVLENPELIDDLISQYKAKDARHYNFLEDKAGEYIWYPVTQEITKKNPISLMLDQNPTIDQVEAIVLKICDKFRDLIENNGLNKLLYDFNKHPKHETAAQLLFYGVAESYCESNNIMIARESNAGRGPVDFKFGSNMKNSVLVEVKKSTNTSGLKKGIVKQLPEYMRAEKSKRAIYLVIDVGYTEAAIDRLKEINELISDSIIRIEHIDGQLKESASK